MNRARRRLGLALQRRGLIQPSAKDDYFAPADLVERAHAEGHRRGMSLDLTRACVRIAIDRADRAGRRVRLEDVVEVFEEYEDDR